jgi:nucleotide-binding universal stress UspA family protein
MLVQTGDARRKGAKKNLIQRILLPLDGSEYSETAIPYATELGSKLSADLVLYTMAKRSHMVTSESDIIGETGMSDEAVNAAEVKRSRSYLKGVAEEMADNGFNVDIMVSLDDDQGNAITRACQEATADLVVMATSGRQPITAWAPGSVAHKLLNKGDLPLLIVS